MLHLSPILKTLSQVALTNEECIRPVNWKVQMNRTDTLGIDSRSDAY